MIKLACVLSLSHLSLIFIAIIRLHSRLVLISFWLLLMILSFWSSHKRPTPVIFSTIPIALFISAAVLFFSDSISPSYIATQLIRSIHSKVDEERWSHRDRRAITARPTETTQNTLLMDVHYAFLPHRVKRFIIALNEILHIYISWPITRLGVHGILATFGGLIEISPGWLALEWQSN